MKHMTDLISKKCVACEGGTPLLDPMVIAELRKQIHNNWNVEGDKKLSRSFKFGDFKEAISFVNRVAVIAEEEQHHPDIFVSYSRVNIELTTHAISGLSENDFIVAAKIDEIQKTLEQ